MCSGDKARFFRHIGDYPMSIVANGSNTYRLSDLFNFSGIITPYLILDGLDRNEYTTASTGATGQFTGNSKNLNFSTITSDARGAGIAFTLQGSRYYNTTYGYLDQLTYTASSQLNDLTDLSLFGSKTLPTITDAYSLLGTAGYLATTTIATQPSFSGAVPTQATPLSISATAMSFVGKAWNMNGCWVLANTISAEAGASLPLTSNAVAVPAQNNGEWIVAYNGPVSSSMLWQNTITAGDIITFVTASGGGHITTCVSGYGQNAMLVDNITYVNSSGGILNPAKDGSSKDILVSAPHAASQEWSCVKDNTVVVYRLDTPTVFADPTTSMFTGTACTLNTWYFQTTDPANKPITQYQIYNTAVSDGLLVSGKAVSAHTQATAASATSLSTVSLSTGATVCNDVVAVRAFNGSYWGDWRNVTVSLSKPVLAPKIINPTLTQNFQVGKPISLMPAAFSDPQGQTLTYTATQTNGAALPSWLTFNTAWDVFSANAHITQESLGIKLTATNTGHVSTSETFNLNVYALPPVLAHQTPNLTFQSGGTLAYMLPNTFTDPQNGTLAYKATQTSGIGIGGWLKFNGNLLSGLIPPLATPQTFGLAVSATNAYSQTSVENFTVTLLAAHATTIGHS